MALLDPNHANQDLRISTLLPSVKCSSCSQPVPLDQLGDHTCSPALAPSNPARNTKPSLPPLNVQTAPSPSITGPSTSMNAHFPRRPSTNRQQDGRVYDGARPRNGPSFSSSVPPRGVAPSPAPSRNGVRSPGPAISPTSPSRLAHSPLVSPSSPTHQSIPRTALHPNGVAPAIPRPGLSMLDARLPAHRRPSASSSPLAQRQPPPQSFRDPRSAPMAPHPPVNNPVRSASSPAPSEYRSQRRESPDIDTQSGGSAGMAGVGRRGFAAVARAAMFATSHKSPLRSPTAPSPAPWDPALSPPRAAPPMPYSHPASHTPASLPSPSHDSRFSSNIPLPPPSSSSPAPSVTPPLHERENSAIPTPSSIPFPVKPSDTPKSSAASGPLTPTSPTGPRFSSDKSSQKKASGSGDTIKVVIRDKVNSSYLDHTSDDEGSEVGGLAYDQSDESDNEALLARGVGRTSHRLRRSPSISSAYSDDRPPTERPFENDLDTVLATLLRSPTSTDTSLSPGSPPSSLLRASKPPMRSLTSIVQRESSAMGGTIVRRGGTISGAIGGGSTDDPKKDRVSKESTVSGLASLAKHGNALTCMRCSKIIEDKRWIRMENGRGVLCDKCWKNMYLPKCRRCSLPIEKQAVSSSDGQLKGKYHRECFNCHTCHKPFPDKTFYVFDGKPFCDYHYHEANHSLCAAPDCGRPIEGPCAVSHTGDRYHVEHLTCEYDDDGYGKRCDERLVDYWEIEGRMLCERHMRQVAEQDMMNVGLNGHGKTSDSRAMKRKTRFIDIAGLR